MRISPPSHEAIAVIFAGGSGKRLWPISTEELPKQLNTAFSKKTLVGEAFDRVKSLFPPERIVIVTTEAQEEKIKEIISLPEKNWIVQPKNADTAAAMCLTALHLESRFPESTAILFYSDHKISDTVDFKRAIREIKKIAEEYPFLISVGTRPVDANTQFGYIKLGEKQAHQGLYKVAEFAEKPDEATAQKYVDSGKYVWNTGVYAWQTNVLLNVLKEVAPDLYNSLLELKLNVGDSSYQQKVEKWFDEIEPLAFEKAVSERLSEMYVYVADYSWKDVGNWNTVYELASKDADGNAVLEETTSDSVTFLQSKNSMVLSEISKVAVIGLDDLFVIQTDDSLLICHKDKVGEVKKIVEEEE